MCTQNLSISIVRRLSRHMCDNYTFVKQSNSLQCEYTKYSVTIKVQDWHNKVYIEFLSDFFISDVI